MASDLQIPPVDLNCACALIRVPHISEMLFALQLRGFGFFEEQPARVRYRFLKSPNGFMKQFDGQFRLEDVSTGATVSVKTVMPTKKPPFQTQTDAMRGFHLEADVPVADVFRLWLDNSSWHQACHLPAFQACSPKYLKLSRSRMWTSNSQCL